MKRAKGMKKNLYIMLFWALMFPQYMQADFFNRLQQGFAITLGIAVSGYFLYNRIRKIENKELSSASPSPILKPQPMLAQPLPEVTRYVKAREAFEESLKRCQDENQQMSAEDIKTHAALFQKMEALKRKLPNNRVFGLYS